MATAESTKAKYLWEAGMTCGGCVSGLTKTLERYKTKNDVDMEFTVSLEDKTVTVECQESDTEGITQAMQKWATARDKSLSFKGLVEI